tara:strand:- start:31 stop:225 length:195 start_codon:yes stop_codon:yes gene_type:complete
MNLNFSFNDLIKSFIWNFAQFKEKTKNQVKSTGNELKNLSEEKRRDSSRALKMTFCPGCVVNLG